MIPDPLHPAIVHFPIVLLLLGAPLSLAAVIWRKHFLPALAASVLVLGAAGAVAAVFTGGNDAEMAGELSGNGEQILEEHEEWGERARNFGIVAAILACASVAAFRWATPARGLGAVAAIAAIASAYAVAQAGHYGGQVVYKHGVGVNTAAGQTDAGTSRPGGGKTDEDD